MNLWVWHRSVDFSFGFSLQSFCVLYFILSEFMFKDALECIVNPTYLIGCCDYTLINLVLKNIVLIFNTIHKMGCCEYCYWLEWYNTCCVKLGSINYPSLDNSSWYVLYNPPFLFFVPREKSTCNNFCLIIFCYFYYYYFYFVSDTFIFIFTLCSFCVRIKDGFLNVSPF